MQALADAGNFRDEIAALGRENHIIDKQLAQLEGISQIDGAGVGTIQQKIRALLKQKQNNMASVKAKSKKLRKVVSLLSLSTTRRLEPEWTDADLTNSMLVNVIAQANQKWLLKNSVGLDFSEEKFAKELSAELKLRFVGAEPVRVGIPSGPIDGLLLRQPLDADVFVCRYKCKPEMLDAYLMAARANALRLEVEKDVLKRLEQENNLSYRGRFSVPQAGRPVIIPLHNRAFQNNGIELARDSEGRIQKFGYKTNAAIAAAVTASSDSATRIEGISGTLSNADLLRKQRELDRLTVEEGLLLKQQSIDQLKLELQAN